MNDKIPKIQFSKKWVNPLFFILQDILKDETIKTVLIYGGKSSAKTVSICQLLAKEAVISGASTMALRKEGTLLQGSLKASFELAINTLWLQPAFEILEYSIRSVNGAKILFKGIDNAEKAKGIEGFKFVLLDELNAFGRLEYLQFQNSLRGIPGQKIFATWNPVDENSWLKTHLVDPEPWIDLPCPLPDPASFIKRSGNKILIKTCYQDNFWIAGSPDRSYGWRDENLLQDYDKMQYTDANEYKVNVLGEWGKTVYGGEILKCWKTERDTGSYAYDPELAIYLSFDENVNPYFPCGFFQVSADNKTSTLFDVITAKNPNNTVKWMCAEIRRKLYGWGHKGRLFIGGDATSDKEDVKQEKGHDLFRLIMNELADFKPERKVAASNPSVAMSYMFFNSILAENTQGLVFRVDSKCRAAILDFENTKEDKNGKVDKKTVTDQVTKVSYQPWGHISDLTRYHLTTAFYDEYLNYQRGDAAPVLLTGGSRRDNGRFVGRRNN